jgi:drug/metabolite transporter (DMT)-like permease
MTKAFMHTNTALVAPFQYVGAIYALLSGWFVFNEQLEIWSLLGIVLVLMGVVLGTVFRSKQPLVSETKH